MPVPALPGVSYEHPELVDNVFRKAVAYRPTGISFEAMAGVSTVLDFGGGCGHAYKDAAVASPNVRWAVVETPAMVRRASQIETESLRFFTETWQAAEWLRDIEVVHSNGALQYTADPLVTLRELCALDAKTMVWRRMRLSRRSFEYEIVKSRLADNGPGAPPPGLIDKTVSCLVTRMPEPLFIAAHRGYNLAARTSEDFRFEKIK